MVGFLGRVERAHADRACPRSPSDLFKLHRQIDIVLPLKGYCKYPPMIVTELMEQGSLRQHLVSRNWDRATGLKLLLDVASGMAYLHSKFILHGDLRDSNILVNGDRALVADFGLYKIRQHIADSTTGAATAGNQGLIAPEIIEGGRWNAPADVYSFAILCYEVLSGGKYPFEGEGSPIAMLYKVAVERARPARPDGISDDMWWLLERCWAHDPKERPTFEEIEHELQYIVKEHGSA